MRQFARTRSVAPARRRASALLACGIVLAAAGTGCGGGGDRAAEDAAEAVVRDYVGALVAGDGERACELMTDAVRRRFEEREEGGGCPSAFARSSDLLGREQRRLLTEADVDIDEVDGDVATGTIRVEGGLSTPIEVRRVAGDWRYATEPGGPRPPSRTTD